MNHLREILTIIGVALQLTLAVYLSHQKDEIPPTKSGVERNSAFEIITRTP